MVPNVDPKNGISYGFHSNTGVAQGVIEDVFSEGTNLTLKRFQAEVLEACFENRFVEFHDGETPADVLRQIAKSCHITFDEDEIGDIIASHYEIDDENGAFDFAAVANFIEEKINNSGWDPDEQKYLKTFRDDDEKVLMVAQISWLGGAPGLDILWSTEAAWCRACSPCAPNQGDLEHATSADNGNCLAYCVPAVLIGELKPGQEPWYKAVVKVADLEKDTLAEEAK